MQVTKTKKENRVRCYKKHHVTKGGAFKLHSNTWLFRRRPRLAIPTYLSSHAATRSGVSFAWHQNRIMRSVRAALTCDWRDVGDKKK